MSRQPQMVLGHTKMVRRARAISLVFLLIVGLMAVLPPRPTLAQGEKLGLSLWLVSGPYDNKVTPGKDNAFFLEVRNTGNQALTDIRLSSVKPEGWVINFKPGRIDYLAPSNFQTVDVNIKPPVKTRERRYTVTLVAETNEVRKVEDIWLGVEAPRGTWLWVGGIIVLVVVAGFIVVFRRFGRQ